jgi:phospholipase C
MLNPIQEIATPRKLMALLMALTITLGPSAAPAWAASNPSTPVKHIVVIFQENISFDHYFGTYPNALNPPGEPPFRALPGTPTVNGLTNALLNNNPNLNPANGTGATNPFRLDRTQAVTADQNHDYTAEQEASDMGAMDLFPEFAGSAGPPPTGTPVVGTNGLNLGYYDGNTVTAFWNYAQHFAINDNSFSSTFGPSTPGVINLVSGQTNGAIAGSGGTVDGGNGSLTIIGDPDPLNDVCAGNSQAQLQGANIGDLLTAAGVSWGSFMGGFNLGLTNANGTSGCGRSSTGLAGTTGDYIPHHSFFGYWASTANPTHARPNTIGEIGNAGPANHNYDVLDFYAAVEHGNFPAVSFIKAPGIQDGHAGYSDPLDEQNFVVTLINFLQLQSSWKETAVVILYDDSDGWYDHQLAPLVNQSTGSADALTAPNACGTGGLSLPGVDSGNPHALGRCGYGMRQPLLVISPWAKENFVDHTTTDQTSVIRFIEDNWLNGQRIGQGSFDGIASSISQMFDFKVHRTDGDLLLDPKTGEPLPLGHP